jgi:hypothetical protein
MQMTTNTPARHGQNAPHAGSQNMQVLRKLFESGEFHHATYRNEGTLWEGLWFYRRKPDGFRGYEVAGCILKDDQSLDDAYRLIGGTGISRGSFGNG